MTTSILLVDDEPGVLGALQRVLRRHFAGVVHCEAYTDALQALQRCREQRFHIVIADLRMPEIDGISFLSLLTTVQPDAVRLMLTGSPNFETAQRAINEAGVFRYLCKPWSEGELVSHVEAALALVRARPQPAPPSPEEAERQRLERLEPGITQVDFGPDGAVQMPALHATISIA
jgi:two-component system, probable response regulator PhcQ